MSESGTPDLSRIVGLMLENPKLIEEISGLVKSSGEKNDSVSETTETAAVSDTVEQTAPTVADAPVSAEATYPAVGAKRGNRGRLLGSLKPYLSEKRANAIDTMITISDVLDSMKGR